MSSIYDLHFIKLSEFKDDRGSFVKIFDHNSYRDQQKFCVKQVNISVNAIRGTVRGMHTQALSKPEKKIVTCNSGAVLDVLIDLRKSSPTYSYIESYELSSKSGIGILVPSGVFHGFQTLEDNTILTYLHDVEYSACDQLSVCPLSEEILKYWQFDVTSISDKDANAIKLKDYEGV